MANNKIKIDLNQRKLKIFSFFRFANFYHKFIYNYLDILIYLI